MFTGTIYRFSVRNAFPCKAADPARGSWEDRRTRVKEARCQGGGCDVQPGDAVRPHRPPIPVLWRANSERDRLSDLLNSADRLDRARSIGLPRWRQELVGANPGRAFSCRRPWQAFWRLLVPAYDPRTVTVVGCRLLHMPAIRIAPPRRR